MKNLSNRMIHLTNDAVQKKCEEYGKYEPGNKLSFSDFQRYLDTNYNGSESNSKLKFWQQAYPEMKKLATEVIRSVYTKINPSKKEFTFEIFGLDFLIDENFKVWLI
jgi:tubulin monoglycylase TTLL3/8